MAIFVPVYVGLYLLQSHSALLFQESDERVSLFAYGLPDPNPKELLVVIIFTSKKFAI